MKFKKIKNRTIKLFSNKNANNPHFLFTTYLSMYLLASTLSKAVTTTSCFV